jgi:hypothetical protein
MVLHSKRSAEIGDELVRVGFDSYRARGHAARNSRTAKRHHEELTPENVQALVADLLSPTGRLAAQKVFSRRDVVVAAAPPLFEVDPQELGRLRPEGTRTASKSMVARPHTLPDRAPLPALDGLLQLIEQCGEEEPRRSPPAVEVVVERRLRPSRGLGDVLDLGGVEAALGGQRSCSRI